MQFENYENPRHAVGRCYLTLLSLSPTISATIPIILYPTTTYLIHTKWSSFIVLSIYCQATFYTFRAQAAQISAPKTLVFWYWYSSCSLYLYICKPCIWTLLCFVVDTSSEFSWLHMLIYTPLASLAYFCNANQCNTLSAIQGHSHSGCLITVHCECTPQWSIHNSLFEGFDREFIGNTDVYPEIRLISGYNFLIYVTRNKKIWNH